jgi:serine protease Do
MQHNPVACGVSLIYVLLGTLLCSAVVAQEPPALATATAMQRLVTDAIQRAEKSVVAISRVRKEQVEDGHAVPSVPPLDALRQEAAPTDPRYVPTEFGTGVVIDHSGLVVTNYHVLGNVKRADFYVWHSRKPFRATVKAADPWLDLAVLKIDGAAFNAMPLGDAQSLKKGQFVIALGNPYAIARDGQPSASLGIISNLQRQAPPPPAAATRAADGRETLHHYGTLIQTDARLELGTSGGALVNLQGEMIGLTTSLAALYGYERPGGFAIPVDDAFRRTLESLKTGRIPDYGLLGVEPAAIAVDLRQRGRTGARVVSIANGTPAKSAGLRDGDVVTHVDGIAVHDDLELIRQVSGQFAGAPVALSLLRGGNDRRVGQAMTVTAKLSKKRIDSARQPYSELAPEIWRGLQVDYATASSHFAQRSRELDPLGCVAVIDVTRESPAWKAGLRPGDFVSHVGDSRATTPREFYDAVALIEGPVKLKLTGGDRLAAIRTIEPDAP